MQFPSWFLKAIEDRMEEVSLLIEREPKFRKVRSEESRAFHLLFADRDMLKSLEFTNWEEHHEQRQSMFNEMLYMQGIRDGVKLAVSLLCYASSEDNS